MEEIKQGYKQTDIGVIPEDWEVRPIGEVLKITTGNRNTQDKKDDGLYPFFVRSQIVERINSYSFDGEAVLTAGDGVGTGKVFHYINGKFDYHQRVYLIHGFDDKIIGKYFYWFFSKYFFERINQLTAKSSVDSVRREMIADMLVPLPKKEEQTAIATALSDTDALIATLDKKIIKKQQIKQGAMQQLLTGKKRLPGFSGEWVEKKLGEVGKISMGQSPLSQFYNCERRGLPLIQGNADIEKRQTIIRVYTSQVTKMCDIGDIILSVRAPVGAVAKSTLAACIGRGVCAIKSENDYLFHYLVSIENDWGKYSKGSTFDSISSNELYEVVLSIPVSEIEQNAIAQILTDMDNEIARLQKDRDKYKEIKAGMMQVLLTGRVRLV